MADRVAEVEHLAPAGVALVRGDDRELRARAGEIMRSSTSPPAATRSHSAPPAISAVLSTSA